MKVNYKQAQDKAFGRVGQQLKSITIPRIERRHVKPHYQFFFPIEIQGIYFVIVTKYKERTQSELITFTSVALSITRVGAPGCKKTVPWIFIPPCAARPQTLACSRYVTWRIIHHKQLPLVQKWHEQ